MSYFRAIKSAVSLKPAVVQKTVEEWLNFRAIKSAVSLKHCHADAWLAAAGEFPRDQKRGLIEASYELELFAGFAANFRAIKSAVSLKRSFVTLYEEHGDNFRAIKSAVSLKHADETSGANQLYISARSKARSH